MANKLQIKRSSVPGKVPTTADLDLGELAINTYDGKAYMKKNVSGVESVVLLTGAGAGDVTGPGSSGDNAIARFDGVTGKIIQNSSASIDDSGNLSSTTQNATGTGANKMPVGTTAQRPASPQSGMYRMNTTTGNPEWYSEVLGAWVPFSESTYQVEYLVIAGGAGAGQRRSGGGGAGGYRNSVTGESSGGGASAESKKTVVPLNSYTITIGAGGSGRPANDASGYGGNGSNTVFDNITAIGGGGGGSISGGGGFAQGQTGGSGGGSGSTGSGGGAGPSLSGGSGTSGQGYNGGANNYLTNPNNGGGGGGGAGGSGGAASGSTGGSGGAAANSSINGSGTLRAWGGAGGGFSSMGSGTSGSQGSGEGASAGANTGGGGNGVTETGFTSIASGNGGSGIVIIRYAGAQRGTGGTVTSSGGYTIHTFTSSGTFVA